jgi:hypothetical protein
MVIKHIKDAMVNKNPETANPILAHPLSVADSATNIWPIHRYIHHVP